jgi:hypothetical protein
VIASIAPSSAFSEADLEMPADLETTSTNSDLFIIGPLALIDEKRISCAAEPSGIKGSCGKIFSVVLSTNADVNCAGFFIASAKSRCQAHTKKYFLATAVPAL